MMKPERQGRRQRAAQLEAMPADPKCNAAPGAIRPVVDFRSCEGKGACAEVCPYDVFDVATIDDASFAELPLLNRFKTWAHGKKVAYVPNADACRACGLCVVACPERAIRLEKVA